MSFREVLMIRLQKKYTEERNNKTELRAGLYVK
jgi:hypothetical protein